MKEIMEKLDKIQEELVEIRIDLNHHIYRTTQNEETIAIIKKELTPVRDHVLKVNFSIAIIGAFGASITVIYAIVKIASFFQH